MMHLFLKMMVLRQQNAATKRKKSDARDGPNNGNRGPLKEVSNKVLQTYIYRACNRPGPGRISRPAGLKMHSEPEKATLLFFRNAI